MASVAISSRISESGRARLLRVIEIVPPPGGSTNPCAQPSTGAETGLSACPFSVAVQPPYGSARIRVPPAAGAAAPLRFTVPDVSTVVVPSAATTRARPTGPATCQRS
jgi:hypothetical protein